MDGTSHHPAYSFCSLNCRGLGKDSKLLLLDRQLDKIRWDIVALQETKRRGLSTLTLPSGSVLHSYSSNSIHGTGFVVSPSMSLQASNFNAISSRVSSLDINTGQQTIRIISCYAPTSSASDEDYTNFLKEVTGVLHTCTSHTTPLLLGDFNAKLGNTADNDIHIGQYGSGQRNVRGDQLLEYLRLQNLRCWTTFFNKKIHRRWTWRSPDGQTRNEIDYTIAPVSSVLLFTDIGVMNAFDYDSDHRLTRTTVMIRHGKRRPTCRQRGERYFARYDVE